MTKDDIKLRNPKTCNHCPAFMLSISGWQCCTLGYKIDILKEGRIWRHYTTWEDLHVRIKPAEPCPKPKNVSECVEIRKVINVHRYADPAAPEYEKGETMSEEESRIQYINYKDPWKY